MSEPAKVQLTRRYRFAASHRLHTPRLSEAENERVYGKCNHPFGHGHDYVLGLTVEGELDRATGVLVPIARLDAFVDEKILRVFSHRNLNVDVPQFRELVATTENMARVTAELVEDAWEGWFGELSVWPARIHIQETERNGFEILLKKPRGEKPAAKRNESVSVNA